MSNDNESILIIAIIVFGIMFIAHTVSDYNLVADTRNFCRQIKPEKHIEVIK